MPAPADSPCRMRNAHRYWIECADAQPNDATTNTTSDTRITIRRPSASDSAPCHRIMIANASRYAVIVCWTWIADASSDRSISGNAGRYVSIENGPSIASAASMIASRVRLGIATTRGFGIG